MMPKRSSLLLFSSIYMFAFLALKTSFCLSESKPLADYDEDKSSVEKSYKIVCYYTNWAQYRTKPATFLPENVNASLCTHVIFAFAKINEQSELQAYEWNDESTEWFENLVVELFFTDCYLLFF
jgi:GH18 family chitinase